MNDTESNAFPIGRGHHRLLVPPNTIDRETKRQAVSVALVVPYSDGSKRVTSTPKAKAKRSHYYSALGRAR
jgi:hypothetical protein